MVKTNLEGIKIGISLEFKIEEEDNRIKSVVYHPTDNLKIAALT